MAKLTTKQELFCREYLIDGNATQAAIRAGYSKKTAKVVGCQTLTKANVAAYLAKEKAKRAERLKVDADYVLKRLVDEVEADLADLYDDNGNLRPIKDWPLIWRQGLVAGVDVQRLTSHDDSPGEIVKLKLSDRAQRLVSIGKHIDVQAFRDQLNHSGKVDVVPVLNVTVGSQS